MDSNNKALARGDGLGGHGANATLLPRRRDTDKEVEFLVDAITDSGWSRGRLKLLFGDLHTMAMASQCHP